MEPCPAKVTTGVHEGSGLGPLLFFVYFITNITVKFSLIRYCLRMTVSCTGIFAARRILAYYSKASNELTCGVKLAHAVKLGNARQLDINQNNPTNSFILCE